MNKALLPWLAMVYMGAMWGLSFSLGKLATQYGAAPMGISFWSAFFSGCLLLIYCLLTGRYFSLSWALIKTICILGLLGSLARFAFLLRSLQGPRRCFIHHRNFGTDFHLRLGAFAAH
jgi:drug/metabolite transporter (DMT)-like permease